MNDSAAQGKPRRRRVFRGNYAGEFPRDAFSWEWGTVIARLGCQNAFDHEKWREAGSQCFPLLCEAPASEKPLWHDRMVCCYRRDGWRGRPALAFLSTQHLVRDMESAVDPLQHPETGRPDGLN